MIPFRTRAEPVIVAEGLFHGEAAAEEPGMAISSHRPNPAADRGCRTCRSHSPSSPTPGPASPVQDLTPSRLYRPGIRVPPADTVPGVLGKPFGQGCKKPVAFFFPLPRGQRALRPIFTPVRSSCAWLAWCYADERPLAAAIKQLSQNIVNRLWTKAAKFTKPCWEVSEPTPQHRRLTLASQTRTQALPTIWDVPCALWSTISEILLQAYPLKKRGRPRSCFRKILNGIIYRMRTGAQWNRLPKEFGDDGTVHRWFQRWCKDRIMNRIWSALATRCNDLAGVFWDWQAVDTRMGKARFGGDKIGKNPTDRAKPGARISVLADQHGGPLGAVTAGADVHDTKLLADTLDAVVVERPLPTSGKPQHLCLDKAYDNPTGHHAVEERVTRWSCAHPARACACPPKTRKQG